MMVLESKGAYDKLHTLHHVFTLIAPVVWMVCNTHYTAYHYAYIYGTLLIQDYLTFVTYKTHFLWNYLSDINETYTRYRGGCRAYIPNLKQIW